MDGGWLRKGMGAAFLPGRYRWWHAAALGIAVNLVSGVLGRPRGDKAYYEGLKQAPFAPPAGVFGPAWTVNNLSVLWGNLRLLNLPANVPHRRALLGLQAATWLIYATFSLVYFCQRSVILAFVWTAADWALTLASVALAARIDRKIALSLATTLAWLTLATPTAAYQAARNPDELFGTPAPIP